MESQGWLFLPKKSTYAESMVIPFILFIVGASSIVTGLQTEPTDMQFTVAGFFLLVIAWVIASRKLDKQK
jgi:hypothetical protein